MPEPTRRAAVLSAVIMFATGAVPAQAELRWERAFDAPSQEPLSTLRVWPRSDGGFVLDGELPGHEYVLQAFDADGRPEGAAQVGSLPRWALPAPEPAEVSLTTFRGPVPLPGSPPPRPCARERIDDASERRHLHWAFDYGHAAGALDGGGGGFAMGTFGPLHRHAPDCTLQIVPGTDGLAMRGLHNMADAVGAWGAVAQPGAPAWRPTELKAWDLDGERWSRRFSSGGEDLAWLRVLGSVDGDLIIGATGDSRSALVRVGPDGALRWQSDLDRSEHFDWALPRPDGWLLLSASQGLGTDRGPYTLHRLDPATGSRSVVAGIDGGHWVRPVPSARADHGVLLYRFMFQVGYDLLQVENGALRRLRELPVGLTPQLWLADGTLLAMRSESFTHPLSGVGESAPASLWMLDPATDAPPQRLPDPQLDWPQRLAAARIAEGGSHLLLWRQDRYRLHAIDEDGRERWHGVLPRREFGGYRSQSLNPRLLADDEAVCVTVNRIGPLRSDGSGDGGENSLACVARADGSLRAGWIDIGEPSRPWRLVVALALLPPSPGAAVSVLARVNVLGYGCPAAADCAGRLQRLDIAADGGVTRTDLVLQGADQRLQLLHADAGGRALIAVFDTTTGVGRIERLAADGQRSLLAALPGSWSRAGAAVQQTAVLGDGSIAVLGGGLDGELSGIAWIDADGGLRRHLVLDQERVAPGATLVGHAGVLALVTVRDGRLWLRALDANGARWETDIGDAADRVHALAIDPTGAQLRVALERAGVLAARIVDAADGRDVGFVHHRIGDGVVGAGWTPDGDLLVADRGAAPWLGTPSPPRLQRLRVPTAEDVGSPLDGLWHDPGRRGQGLYLQQFGDGQVGGAWMTYTAAGGTDRAALRWYTLVGSEDEHGLSILQTTGGAFAMPPARASREVGRATLRSLDADRRVLDYRFDADLDGDIAARSGRLLLERLTPADAAHAQRTGAWFEPATSGQGLTLQVFDHGEATRLTGTWFTFDPAGRSDDPTAQHWFTLLGAAADDDRFDVDVWRTIGGSFDAAATDNTLRVGRGSLRFDGCTSARLQVVFDAPGAAEFHRSEVDITLERIGGCRQ